MFKEVKVKNLIILNFVFLVVISLLMIYLRTGGEVKLDHLVSPEFLYYLENEASPSEIKSIAISHSKGMYSLYESNYSLGIVFICYIIVNIIFLSLIKPRI